ncbi:semaphorin-4E-like isoform X1, partial [Clarias magur]
VSRRLWTCLCGNTLYFFNNAKDTHYVEKLDLSGFVSLIDDCSRDRNLEAARMNLRMKDGEIKLTAPNLEARELWKGFLYSVVDLTVPTTLTLLPGQLHMLKEVVEKERQRRRARSLSRAPSSPLSLPLVGEIPACFRPVSRIEAEVLLERHPDCGNMLLRPGRDGTSLAVTTRQDLNGSVFRHYRVTQKPQGGYIIDVENPIPCPTLHDVINALVEKTAGTLQPFLLEEPYEENITYISSNDENGERTLHCAPTGTFPRRPSLPPKGYGGHVFQEEGVWNYSTMLLREDMGVLILGARETIFALDLNNITHKKAMVKWEVISDMQDTCSKKGKKKETECQNYIRILHKMPDGRMYVCGTNAFNPTCDYMSYTDGNLVLENNQHEGKGRCPFDPFQRSTSEFVDGELYSATSGNFLGSDPVMMRSLNESIRTEFSRSWLSEPRFIGMKHVAEGKDNPEGDDDKIYLFFSEAALEYNSYKKLDVSRVARVCKGDLGGARTLQRKWTSFLKARLDCPVPETKLPFLIQDVFLLCPGNWSTCVFYGVFSPQTDMLQYSAVCAYRIQDIREVFSRSNYKTMDASNSQWVTYNGDVPQPRPGACINNATRQQNIFKSLDVPDKTLQFVKEKPLMDQAVEPSSKQPLLVKKGATFTSIVVASTTALDGSIHQVMFIGTASGSVLKAVNYNGEMVISEEVQLFAHSEPVKILRLSSTVGQLYAGSEVAAAQMPLSACGHYTSCMDCVLARDPYCGWDLTSNGCVAISTTHPNTHSEVVQSLRDGNTSRCPAV